MDMSERIKRRMRALSLKSVDLVKQTGASKGAISHWVNGTSQPSGENLFSLARCLQCSPEWLLLGWTLVGWVVALVWALKSHEPIKTVNVTVPQPTPAPTPAQPSPTSPKQTKQCPYCAEDILMAAKKCKHCGSEV